MTFSQWLFAQNLFQSTIGDLFYLVHESIISSRLDCIIIVNEGCLGSEKPFVIFWMFQEFRDLKQTAVKNYPRIGGLPLGPATNRTKWKQAVMNTMVQLGL